MLHVIGNFLKASSQSEYILIRAGEHCIVLWSERTWKDLVNQTRFFLWPQLCSPGLGSSPFQFRKYTKIQSLFNAFQLVTCWMGVWFTFLIDWNVNGIDPNHAHKCSNVILLKVIPSVYSTWFWKTRQHEQGLSSVPVVWLSVSS